MMANPAITILRDLAYRNDTTVSQPVHVDDEENTQRETDNLNVKQNHPTTFELSKNRLDLFLPNLDTTNSAGSRELSNQAKPPLVVYVHGGGWRRGNRQQWRHFISAHDTNLLFAFIFRVKKLFDNIGETFAKNGVACAVVSYPLQKPHILVTFFELFTSFCMSTMFSMGLFALVMLLLSPLFVINNLTGTEDFYIDQNTKPSQIKLSQLSLIFSQFLTWTMIIFNLKNYRDGLPKLITCSIPFGLLAYGTLFLFNLTSTWTCSLLLVVSLQVSISASQIHHHLSSKKITCEDQIKAVAESVAWLQNFGAKTITFDCREIVLAGHSAGSHLINMLIWNHEKYLQGTNVAINDVKGIISLSGVHNLETINRRLTRHLYLSIFGNNQDGRKELSPINLVSMTRKTNSSPEFLIINAEQDFDFLKEDGLGYSKRLETNGYKVRYEVIPNCNHLSLPMNFWSSESGGKLTTICLDFVKKITCQNFISLYYHRS